MGFLTNISEKQIAKAKEELALILPDEEEIEKVFIVKEDYCAITPKRVILIDKKLIGTKKALVTIPYSKINYVALKRGGMFSISKEVVIGTSGHNMEVDTYNLEEAYQIAKIISERIV